MVDLPCVLAQRQLEGVDLGSRRQLKAEVSLPPPANLECSRLHHLCARSSVHTCTRRARHSSAISHLHRLPSEVHPPSHPIPFQRGRGRREAAQPIVTGTWSTRHSLRRLAVCGPSWSFYSNGWPSRVRAYPNTVELAHQAGGAGGATAGDGAGAGALRLAPPPPPATSQSLPLDS